MIFSENRCALFRIMLEVREPVELQIGTHRTFGGTRLDPLVSGLQRDESGVSTG